MLEVAIMVAGQNGINWKRWQRLVRKVEVFGFTALYRSDHFVNPTPPDPSSLALWPSLTWLAGHTSRIEFGPLVSPVSFRHPVITAQTAAAVDDLSGGRLILGIGAGWQEREHKMYGFELLDIPRRFERLEEGLEVITSLLRSDTPVDFEGRFYQLRNAVVPPRPEYAKGPRILVGGNGPQRTLPLAARYADEWNGNFVSLDKYVELNERLDELLVAVDRRPADVRRSFLTDVIIGRDEGDVTNKIDALQDSEEELQRHGAIVGTPSAIVDQLGRVEEARVDRIILRWRDVGDLTDLALLARTVSA